MDKFKFAPFFLLLGYLVSFFFKTPAISEAIIFTGLSLLFGGQLLLEHFSRPTIEDQVIAHKNELLKELANKEEMYKMELEKVRAEFTDSLTKISMNLLKSSQLSQKGGNNVGERKTPLF